MGNKVFNVSVRQEAGKKVRRNGEIPCVLYGSHLDNTIPLKMTTKDMYKLLASAKNSIFSLNVGGVKKTAVVKELQRDIYGKVMHVDFQNVEKNESIKMKVPVVFKGDGKLQTKGLLLEILMSEVEMYGESDLFPENIECDVEAFEFGDKIIAKDLPIPKGFKLEVKEDAVIATVGRSEAEPEDDETEVADAK